MATKSLAEEIAMIRRDSPDIERFQNAADKFDELVKRGLAKHRTSPEIGISTTSLFVASSKLTKRTFGE